MNATSVTFDTAERLRTAWALIRAALAILLCGKSTIVFHSRVTNFTHIEGKR